MRKLIIFATLLMINPNVWSQPTIPNNGFEQWTDTITPGSGWGTSNLNLGFFTFTPVTQTTDKHSGNYAIKLKTTNTGVAGVLPGVAVTGTYDLLNGATGGIPMTVKPESLSGFIKYNNVNGDTMAILVLMTKWNGASRDTIGIGGVITNQSVSDYTPFNQEIQYDPQNVVPDTFQIMLFSSAGYAPQENSTLFVDDLSFVGTLGEKMPLSVFMQKVYPNPSDGEFNFIPADDKIYSIKVYNSFGQQILEQKNILGQYLINIKGQPKGIYFIDIQNNNFRNSVKVIIN